MSSFGRFGNGQDHAMRELTILIKPLDGKGHARKRPLTVKSWSTVKDLKDILQNLLHLPAASQRIFFRGGELRNPHTLQDCGIYTDGQTVFLASSPQDEMGKPYSLEPFINAGGLPRSLSRALNQARRGLDRGFKPELTLEGTGGTYFLQDAARQKVAVFKPQDEEPFAPNNPREAMQGGLGGGTVSMRPGIDAGESYVREVAAYLLDDRHVHGVPATTLVEAKHPAFCYWDHKERKKVGSFQVFVRHDMVVEDISPSRLTAREVQKIALLDMRLLNRDRNSVNILVRSRPRRSCSFSDRGRGSVTGGGGGGGGAGAMSAPHSRNGSCDSNLGLSMTNDAPPSSRMSSGGSCGGDGGGGLSGGSSGRVGSRRSIGLLGGSTEYELIPIDHGLCLSSELVIDWCDWCWLDWRQVKEPVDPELYNYIQSFDPEATAEKLGNTLNLQESCLRNLCIAETLLMEGTAAGLTLYDIACIMRREDFDKSSELEALVARANELARASVEHQTSVTVPPSKRTVDLTSKSLDANKPTSRARPSTVPLHRSADSGDWAVGSKKGWLLADASQVEESGAGHQSLSLAPARAPESSTDASSEEIFPSSLPDLRVSQDSTDSGSGGGGSGGGSGGSGGGEEVGQGPEPLRVWAPSSRTLSRGSSAAEPASPTRSVDSDAELLSPKGFWRKDENFETIDARNAMRRFSGWEDGTSGEESSPGEGVSGPGLTRRGSGGASADGEGGGRPPLRKDGGSSTSLEGPADSAAGGAGMGVKVGRKLFPSPEKLPSAPPRRKTPPLAIKESDNATTALPSASGTLETMVEGDHESPSPMGSQGPHQPPPWAVTGEPSRDEAGGRDTRMGETQSAEGAGAGPGPGARAGRVCRRGEAGLVVPEPMMQQKPRTLTIQPVAPQRLTRIEGAADQGGGGTGDAKRPLAAPRPSTASPTLPIAAEHKMRASVEFQQALSPGVKITRSYSYHGIGSSALYDSSKRGSARYSLKKRPGENSEQFKVCFFRFLRFLIRDLVKRRQRSIVRERQAKEQAARPSNAAPAITAPISAVRERGAGNYHVDDRLRRQPPPPAPPARGSDTHGPHPGGMPAAVRG